MVVSNHRSDGGQQAGLRSGRHRPVVAVAVAVVALMVASSCGSSDPEPVAGACSASPLSSTIDPPSDETGSVLFEEGFDTIEAGNFSTTELDATWSSPPWNNGVDVGRASVVPSEDEQALRVSYPQGEVGSSGSGVQWQYVFGPEQAVHLSYRVRFGDDFEFVRGGKLPGLAGGEANTGGKIPTGSDGWSGRIMWRSEGCGSFYLYHPDMESEWGDYIDWPAQFEAGRWHEVDQVVVMNTPGERDGAVLGWLDDRMVAERRDLRFRDVDGFAVDVLYFSTFFGGSDESWAPGSDQAIEFDSFVLRAIPADSVER